MWNQRIVSFRKKHVLSFQLTSSWQLKQESPKMSYNFCQYATSNNCRSPAEWQKVSCAGAYWGHARVDWSIRLHSAAQRLQSLTEDDRGAMADRPGHNSTHTNLGQYMQQPALVSTQELWQEKASVFVWHKWWPTVDEHSLRLFHPRGEQGDGQRADSPDPDVFYCVLDRGPTCCGSSSHGVGEKLDRWVKGITLILNCQQVGGNVQFKPLNPQNKPVSV